MRPILTLLVLMLLCSQPVLMAQVQEADLGHDDTPTLPSPDPTGKTLRELLKKADKFSFSNGFEAIRYYELALRQKPSVPDSALLLKELHESYSGFLYRSKADALGNEQALEALKYHFPTTAATPGDYLFIGSIASAYLRAHQLDSAGKYFRLALAAAERSGGKEFISSGWNNLGLWHLSRSDTGSAITCFETALSGLDTMAVLYGSVRDNMADIIRARGGLSEALGMYRANTELYATVKNPNKLLMAEYDIIRTSMTMGDLPQAAEWLQRADADILRYARKDPNERLPLIRLWKDYHIASGNTKAALQTEERATAIIDSVNEAKDRLLAEILVRHRNMELTDHQQQMATIEREAALTRWTAMAVTTVLILAVLLALVVFRSRSRIQEMEKQLIQAQLTMKEGDISELSLVLKGLNRLNERMFQSLEALKGKPVSEQKEAISDMARDLKMELSGLERQATLKTNIDKVNSAFKAKLLERHPNLTQTDVDLCSHILLSLGNKEAAALRNVSYAAAKKARYRLRKKLGLPPEADLHKHLVSL